MNENIDLRNILKNCPKGWEFYSSVLGEVEFEGIFDDRKQADCIVVRTGKLGYTTGFTKEGFYLKGKGECTLFPSKDQRDWSKFTAPWCKKEKFDPKTLEPLESVIVRGDDKSTWFCDSFSYIDPKFRCVCTGGCDYKQCVPYNDETEHLVGTTEEAPEYYKYWED